MRLIIFACVMIAALLFDFRLMNALTVRRDAQVVMHKEACFVTIPADNSCIVRGNVRRRLWTDIVDVTQKDGVQFQIEDSQIAGMGWMSDATEYPLGRIITGVIGLLVLLLPMALLFAIEFRFRKKVKS